MLLVANGVLLLEYLLILACKLFGLASVFLAKLTAELSLLLQGILKIFLSTFHVLLVAKDSILAHHFFFMRQLDKSVDGLGVNS